MTLVLPKRTLRDLAEMICGNRDGIGAHFPYRSSFYLTEFFEDCGFKFIHRSETRNVWVAEMLEKLVRGPSPAPDLPATAILMVIRELLDPSRFEGLDATLALQTLNKSLSRHGLVAYRDQTGRCHVRNDGSGTSSSLMPAVVRPLSEEEIKQRALLEDLLNQYSEDEFTERVLVPFFQMLGYQRVSPSGHREKLQEFGKDLWMKYQLPTGHWIYFAAQVKKGKIDASRSAGANVTEVLTQARMALGHPVFDQDFNRDVLVDHVYIIASGDITRQAKQWIVGKLDQESRRHLIFMDRTEFLDQASRILKLIVPAENAQTSLSVPF